MSAVAYAFTPDPTPVASLEVTPKKVAAGMRAFFRIMEAWGVDNKHARVLLGQPSRSTFFGWKRGVVRTVPHDTVQRLSYILGIYKILQILFKRAQQADAWIQKPNTALGGQSALARMLGGDVTDLAAIRSYLESVRGQGG